MEEKETATEHSLVAEKTEEISPDMFKPSITEKEKTAIVKTDADGIVDAMHKSAIIATAKNDEEINKEIVDSAKATVHSRLNTIKNDNANSEQHSAYDANAEACQSYGIDTAVPVWQIRLMKIGHSVWFVVYFIVASFTICPVKVFFKGINSFIKSTWLAVVVSLIIYLLISVVIPVVTAYVGGLIGGSSATSSVVASMCALI